MKKFFWLVAVGAALLGAAFWFLPDVPIAHPPQAVSFGDETYTLEIADTNAKRSLGLGERDALCESCAMLFLFKKPAEQSFWMGGMRFPLDIVWLLDDKVMHIERYIPRETKTVYRPAVEANQVLELNAGATEELRVGGRVNFSR